MFPSNCRRRRGRPGATCPGLPPRRQRDRRVRSVEGGYGRVRTRKRCAVIREVRVPARLGARLDLRYRPGPVWASCSRTRSLVGYSDSTADRFRSIREDAQAMRSHSRRSHPRPLRRPAAPWPSTPMPPVPRQRPERTLPWPGDPLRRAGPGCRAPRGYAPSATPGERAPSWDASLRALRAAAGCRMRAW